jgi:hypothetical protein
MIIDLNFAECMSARKDNPPSPSRANSHFVQRWLGQTPNVYLRQFRELVCVSFSLIGIYRENTEMIPGEDTINHSHWRVCEKTDSTPHVHFQAAIRVPWVRNILGDAFELEELCVCWRGGLSSFLKPCNTCLQIRTRGLPKAAYSILEMPQGTEHKVESGN